MQRKAWEREAPAERVSMRQSPPYVSAIARDILPAWQTLLATDPLSRETLHQVLGAC